MTHLNVANGRNISLHTSDRILGFHCGQCNVLNQLPIIIFGERYNLGILSNSFLSPPFPSFLYPSSFYTNTIPPTKLWCLTSTVFFATQIIERVFNPLTPLPLLSFQSPTQWWRRAPRDFPLPLTNQVVGALFIVSLILLPTYSFSPILLPLLFDGFLSCLA